MDFTMKQWIVGSILIIIVVIIIDGIRRMRNARRDSLHMSLKVKNDSELDIEDENYGSEFPNGGARPSQKMIDKQRIDRVKNQYDFGRDLSSIINKDNSKKSSESVSEYDMEEVSSDQWVDSDEHDEEYYAEKWDDQPVNNLDSNDLGDERFDGVALGDGNLGDDDLNDKYIDRNQHPTAPAPKEQKSADQDDVDQQGAGEEYVSNATVKKYEEAHEKINEERNEKKTTEEPALRKSTYDSPSYQQPEQVPLNLEESVPVLMESVIEPSIEDSMSSDERHEQSFESTIEEDDIDVDVISAEDTLNAEKINEAGIDDELSESIYNKSSDNIEKENKTPKANIRPVGKHVKPAVEDNDDEVLDTHSANKPRYESKYFSNNSSSSSSAAPGTVATSTIQEVLVVNVKAMKDTMFYGSDLLQQVLDNGLRYGAMEIFHRHADEDGEGPIIFSMANMLKPGTFDLKTIDDFSTAGVTLFLTLPVFDDNNMAAFDLMIVTAKNLANALGGELNDENRSIMTGQTIEHYRERIRDFSRRQQLEKKR
jgi:cell division protein ZipA